jgi:hypothetical protein
MTITLASAVLLAVAGDGAKGTASEVPNGHAPAVTEPEQATAGDPPHHPSIKDKLAAAAARPFVPVPVQAASNAKPDQTISDTAPQAPAPPIMLPNGQAMPDGIKVCSHQSFYFTT